MTEVPNEERPTTPGGVLPLLFVPFIDPLPRWLKEGGRDCNFKTSRAKLAPPMAYTDELAIVMTEKVAQRGYSLTLDQSDAVSAGIFPRWTNQIVPHPSGESGLLL